MLQTQSYLASAPSECSNNAPNTLHIEKPPLPHVIASARPSGVHFKLLTAPQTLPQSNNEAVTHS